MKERNARGERESKTELKDEEEVLEDVLIQRGHHAKQLEATDHNNHRLFCCHTRF